MAKASDNLFPKVLITEGSAPSSPAAGGQALFIDSADHKLKRKNSSGTVTTVEGGGSSFTPKIKSLRYSPAGDIKIGTTSFAAFVTSSGGSSLGTAMDITLPSGSVAAGDTIEVGGNVMWSNQAVDGYISFASIVSGSVVNIFRSSLPGVPGLWGAGGYYGNAAGSTFYVVTSGDLDSGALTVRPVGRCSSASDKVLMVSGNNAAEFWVKNWGPQ